MASQYTIKIRSTTYAFVGEVSNFESLNMTLKYNDVGNWDLTVPASSSVVQYLIAGAGIAVYRDGTYLFSGPIRSTERVGGVANTLKVSGPDDNAVLRDRIALPVTGYPYRGQVLADGATRYWRLGDSTGALEEEVTAGVGGSWNSIQQGYSALINDPDPCSLFNGTSNYGTVNTYGVQAPITFECWVQFNSVAAQQRFYSQLNNFGCGILAGGQLQFSVYGVKDYNSTLAASKMATGKIYHIAFVFTSGFSVQFYVNGVLTETITGTTNAGTSATSGFLGQNGLSAQWLNAYLDEVAIYHTALSAATIQNHYNLGVNRFSQGAYWVDTNKGSTVITDIVGYNVAINADNGRSSNALWPGRINIALLQAADPGVGSVVTSNARFDEMIPLLNQISMAAGDIGFKVTQTGNSIPNCLTLTLYQPADKTSNAKFSQDLGNLIDFTYTVDPPAANYVYVLGGNQGTARIVVEAWDTSSISTYGRIEAVLDSRDTTDSATLAQRGLAYLDANKSKTNLSITPIDTAGLQFLRDYGLGDKVTINLPDGTQIQDVVREVKISLTQQGGEIVQPAIGNTGNGQNPSTLEAVNRNVRTALARVAALEGRY